MTNTPAILGTLPPDRMAHALELIDYMLGAALKAGDAGIVLTEVSERILAAGVPLDRATSIVPLLNAEAVASARFWERGKGARGYAFPYDPNTGTGYADSPAADAHRTGEWVVLWLPDTPDDKYNIVKELKEFGLVHYIMMPVFMANGMSSTFSFATRDKAGFSEVDFAFFRAVFPALAACQEILATHRIMTEVLRMYVGEEPQKRILAGDVHRGDVMRIRSAILFADMRNFTGLTSDMRAEAATAMLNDYFDYIVPSVEQNGGEVLKFMGDGILAIFRAGDDDRATCEGALTAARAALKEVENYTGQPKFRAGVALHFGEVAYGNVGSGMRLDYTVIGRDVNLAARVAGLCGSLEAPLLVSEAFRANMGADDFEARGRHAMKGLTAPEAIFAVPDGPR